MNTHSIAAVLIATAGFLSPASVFAQRQGQLGDRLENASGVAEQAVNSAGKGDMEGASHLIGRVLESMAAAAPAAGTQEKPAFHGPTIDNRTDGQDRGTLTVDVPIPVAASGQREKTMSERFSQLCSDRSRISFDCAASPSIVLLNIAAENERSSPVTYWTVGAAGMIVGAILFIPALLVAAVSGVVGLVKDISGGSQ